MRISAIYCKLIVGLLIVAGLMQATPAQARRRKTPQATLAPRLQA